MKHLLIVYHSKTGKNLMMAEHVNLGARDSLIEGVEVRFLSARDASALDLKWSHGIIFGTPENFGYMSGALKDFFDRTFYEVEGELQGRPYCVFIGAGNDGQGALSSIRRICNGYSFREVLEPVIVKGDLDDVGRKACVDLGMGMAAGLEAGIF